MNSFPKDVQFRSQWRGYQERVLRDLKSHMANGRLHVVAAPGSGKTVLGLEVIRLLNLPSLVLAPTRTIREQWVDRLVHSFLPEPQIPDWVSNELWNPRFLTVATYQALHAAFVGESGSDESLPDEAVEGALDDPEELDGAPEAETAEIASLLRQAGIRVLVVDEAHHLRAEWWKSLMTLFAALEEPTVIALTATPPYDVHPTEWRRYEELCGPVDAEIAVPELVAKGDLCPHQDCISVSAPTLDESFRLTEFRNHVEVFRRDLFENPIFIDAVSQHPWLDEPEAYLEEILSKPAYASSLVIFLKQSNREVSRRLPALLGVGRKNLPAANLEWLEILLTGCLFEDADRYESIRPTLQKLGRRLREIGALERRRVVLRNSTSSARLLTASINKLRSITEIVETEAANLGERLRAVILADFIRRNELPPDHEDNSQFQQLGVVPIFETLRRAHVPGIRLGILSGSLVVIPEAAAIPLRAAVATIGFSNTVVLQKLRDGDGFLTVTFTGAANSSIVRIMTRLFVEGHVTVLVGTTSLLGEGWDAPSINCLIVASTISSFVLSNQMRGRAIRTDPGDPEKTANIWHLVTVEPDWVPGSDYDMLVRRFRSFVGVTRERRVIENGLERMGLGAPPFNREQIEAINSGMKRRALQRETLKSDWKASLDSGTRVVETIDAPAEELPRRLVFANTLAALCWEGGMSALYVVSQILQGAGRAPNLGVLLKILAFAAVAGAMAGGPFLLRALWLFLRHGTLERSLRETGLTLVRALTIARLIRTPLKELQVHAVPASEGRVHCWLQGGTSFEKSLFLNALRELLDPIENPRYLILRRSRWLKLRRTDFHAVPALLGRRKEYASAFYQLWRKHVGSADLVYTRTAEGRVLLLQARAHSLAAGFQSRTRRRSAWK